METLKLGTLCCLLVCLFVFESEGRRCPAGRQKVTTRKNREPFDFHLGPATGPFIQVLRGPDSEAIDMNNLQVLAIDGDNKPFNVKRLCLQIRNADKVEFEYHGELNSIISTDVKMVDNVEGQYTKVCSMDRPKGDVNGIIIYVQNENSFNNGEPVVMNVKKLVMKACV